MFFNPTSNILNIHLFIASTFSIFPEKRPLLGNTPLLALMRTLAAVLAMSEAMSTAERPPPTTITTLSLYTSSSAAQ